MKLFEPISIRGMELKNRLVMAPLQTGVGYRNPRGRAFYVERARGGVSAMILAGMSVDLFYSDEAWDRPGGAKAFVEGFKVLTQEVQVHGVKVGPQLWQSNRYPCGLGVERDGEWVAPSAREGMREITKAEIRDVINRFAQATVIAKEAGCDFVEVHNAHGYLFCQFFSPADNHRQDEYGGSLVGRMQFSVECVQAMRAAAGDDFPIFVRIGAKEDRPGGIVVEEAALFANALEKAGADVIDVSLGGGGRSRSASPQQKEGFGVFLPMVDVIKPHVIIPVMAVGRIHTKEIAEDTLVRGRADLIGLGRQLIADPFWPKKVLEGRESEIALCDTCNTLCYGYQRGEVLGCRQNPRAGKELETPAPE
ncbi:MAG: NADH:flavin oxidoreductase [Chloroflexi bacterium]|nr:NADH:flavin oxidoreductase [Chloroflexota bacterium]